MKVKAHREIRVGPDGALTGLRVVGFHGEVEAAHTPARREPVLVDDENRLVRIERIEASTNGDAPPSAIWIETGSRVAPDQPLPGVATRIGPFPAFLGHQIVLVGTMEQRFADRLLQVREHQQVLGVQAFVEWLESTQSAQPDGLTVERLGELAIWSCRVDQAHALFERIRQVATEEVLRVAALREHGQLYDASWWLSRAALDDADIFLAAAGLEQAKDPGMADVLIRSTLRKRSQEQIEAGLEHARRRLQSMIIAQGPRVLSTAPQRQVDIGSLANERNNVRLRGGLVPSRKAA